ncbi:Uncharacterised protein [Chlamydia trachomatis]|nr:Uncharacterised protein [Chlamydia trachomatis]
MTARYICPLLPCLKLSARTVMYLAPTYFIMVVVRACLLWVILIILLLSRPLIKTRRPLFLRCLDINTGCFGCICLTLISLVFLMLSYITLTQSALFGLVEVLRWAADSPWVLALVVILYTIDLMIQKTHPSLLLGTQTAEIMFLWIINRHSF